VDDLIPLVYDELRRLAALKLSREPGEHSMQATGLVHEAYLRLVGGDRSTFAGRGHFFAAAAESMRRILVERARRRACEKRGGGRKHFEIGERDLVGEPQPDQLLALDEALDRLAREDGVKATLVKLRYFVGLTVEQSAEVLGVSRATADRYWSYARAWLYHEISDGDGTGNGDAARQTARIVRVL
jgi:RNA polymerase sigma factor (TIGR02999 family)